MNCIYCNTSVHFTPLHRTNKVGSEDPGFACFNCISIHEPELAKNIKESSEYQIVNILTNGGQKTRTSKK